MMTAAVPAQMTSLGPLGSLFAVGGTWNWELGTLVPQPQTTTMLSAFPFTVASSGGAVDWLNITPTSGVPGTMVTSTPIVSKLGAGTYTETVTVTQQLPRDLAQFGPSAVTSASTITVTTQPLISTGGEEAVFDANPGGPAPAPMTIPVSSNGTPAAFTTSITGGSWLTVAPPPEQLPRL
jgi:hypothetical protein